MAHLLLTVEPDPERRSEFRRRAHQRFSLLPGLQVQSVAAGDCAIFWACRQHTPHSSVQTPTSCTLLLGYALNDQGRRLAADEYASEWPDRNLPPPAHDGYFAGIRYATRQGLTVEVDPWGMFPMYYTRIGSSLLAGSSADFFHCHPGFVERVDPAGLAGILLTNGLIGDHTLLQNVKQLAAGHCLVSTPRGDAREIRNYQPAVRSPLTPQSEQQLLEATQHALRQAIQRHSPPDAATTIMLSGGLDSRLIAGSLQQLDIDVSAATLGLATDFEVQAAQQVAAALGMPSAVLNDAPEPSHLPDLARTLAREQHLSGGFSNLEFGADCHAAADSAPWFWSGFFIDDLLGGCGHWFALDPRNGQCSCDGFLRRLYGWGLHPAACRSLLNLPAYAAAGVVEDCLQRFRARWNSLPGEPAQRSLLTKLQTRMRYHVAAALHRMSFSSWPLLPMLDRQFVEFMLQVPAAAVRSCRLQNRLVCSQFPQLARIPLDGNSFRFEPVALQRQQSPHLGQRLLASGRKRWNEFYWNIWRRTEPRRYYRTYDLNGDIWRIVRETAEPARGQLEAWLVPDEVNRIVPRPGSTIRLQDRFREGTRIRTLLGLMLWTQGAAATARRAA